MRLKREPSHCIKTETRKKKPPKKHGSCLFDQASHEVIGQDTTWKDKVEIMRSVR